MRNLRPSSAMSPSPFSETTTGTPSSSLSTCVSLLLASPSSSPFLSFTLRQRGILVVVCIDPCRAFFHLTPSIVAAFIVAWGGMSSQCARLVGIIILTLDLKRSHIRRSESWSLWAGVVIALGTHPSLIAPYLLNMLHSIRIRNECCQYRNHTVGI